MSAHLFLRTTAVSLILASSNLASATNITLKDRDLVGEEESLSSIANKGVRLLQTENGDMQIGGSYTQTLNFPYSYGTEAAESDLLDVKNKVIGSEQLVYPDTFENYEKASKVKIKNAFNRPPLNQINGNAYADVVDNVSVKIFKASQHDLATSKNRGEWTRDNKLGARITFTRNKDEKVSLWIEDLNVVLPLYEAYRRSHMNSYTAKDGVLNKDQEVTAQFMNRLLLEIPSAFKKGLSYRLQNPNAAMEDLWKFITGSNSILIYPKRNVVFKVVFEGLPDEYYSEKLAEVLWNTPTPQNPSITFRESTSGEVHKTALKLFNARATQSGLPPLQEALQIYYDREKKETPFLSALSDLIKFTKGNITSSSEEIKKEYLQDPKFQFFMETKTERPDEYYSKLLADVLWNTLTPQNSSITFSESQSGKAHKNALTLFNAYGGGATTLQDALKIYHDSRKQETPFLSAFTHLDKCITGGNINAFGQEIREEYLQHPKIKAQLMAEQPVNLIEKQEVNDLSVQVKPSLKNQSLQMSVVEHNDHSVQVDDPLNLNNISFPSFSHGSIKSLPHNRSVQVNPLSLMDESFNLSPITTHSYIEQSIQVNSKSLDKNKKQINPFNIEDKSLVQSEWIEKSQSLMNEKLEESLAVSEYLNEKDTSEKLVQATAAMENKAVQNGSSLNQSFEIISDKKGNSGSFEIVNDSK